ncbi:MAG: acetoacetate--CoA ligase [Oceanospirillales bacterium LUC14_002_19_P2]|nr:MAG: acetoacetate--CoA ligase [Oceanospirillales bacterium LUC14_002_19_P2]
MNTPLWSPSEEQVRTSALWRFMLAVNERFGTDHKRYDALYQWSVANSPEFWAFLVEYQNIHFSQPALQVFADAESLPDTRWFEGATLNYAEHLLRSRDEKSALVFCREDGERQAVSHAELYQQVARAAEALRNAGIEKGDRVAGLLPNCIETVVMMLATTSLGAIWSSCSPDFGFNGVLDRFGQINPKLLIAADGYFYNAKTIDTLERLKALEEAIPSLQNVIVIPFLNGKTDNITTAGFMPYGTFIDNKADSIRFEPVAFNHPLYILYSSGTTGAPKCIVHGHGGTLLQHAKELSLHTDIGNSDILFYFTTCGWMMWNWQTSALMTGATVVLYDGSPFHPGPDALWRIIEQEQVSVFGTSARYISALEKAGYRPADHHNLSALQRILSTGSPLLHESFDFVYDAISSDINLASISGGTDIVSCFALGCPIRPVYRGQLQCRGLGMDVQFISSEGGILKEQKGELVCRNSFPSMPVSFWNDPDGKKYRKAYFEAHPGLWSHGDYGELTAEDGVIIFGRSDAVLNPGGVRIGTAEIYRQVEKIPEVQESLAVGHLEDGDEKVVLFVRLSGDQTLDECLESFIRKTIRANTTPRHVPAKILQVADLPRTVSGKLSELAVKATINGETVKNTDALINPESLEYFKNIL